MSESEPTPLIDSLNIKDYSSQPREQWGLVGERSAIRAIDPDDRIDIQRVFDIDRQRGVLEFNYGGEEAKKTERESIDWANQEVHMFAVSGSEGVSKDEIGELQGWIWFYKDEESRLEQVREASLLELPNGVEVLEVSFAKYEKAPPGQMQSALRQALVAIAAIRGHGDSEGVKPNLVVTAYTEAGNDKSIKTLEASGFKLKGKVVYDSKDSLEPDLFYVLDWGGLNKIVHEKSDNAIHEKIATINSETS